MAHQQKLYCVKNMVSLCENLSIKYKYHMKVLPKTEVKIKDTLSIQKHQTTAK